MKGFKDLKDFIKEIIYYEKTYYIIDSKFWNEWKEHVNWNKEENNPDDSHKEKNQLDLKFNLSLIIDNNYTGKLKQGLVYCNDYYIVSPKYILSEILGFGSYSLIGTLRVVII
jgi:hypothetical protein